ncbi:MAG: sigma-70 family RNA polymerase sigma factor [Gammaproteobacteria bacterium]|nr:sigma-70 family RNA polymerase sigma factor [Gammaproteobacteria bacterium]
MLEQDLINRLLNGDENAYRQVVTDYHSSMLYVARAIIGTAIADEIVQEAWISVIKALPKFEGRSSLKTWILRIVSNNAKSRLRKESKHFSAGDAADLETIGMPHDRFSDDGHWAIPPSRWNIESPEELLTSDELQSCVRQAIDKLPAIQQTILSLRDMDGMSMEDICKILEISESNSRVLLHRARTRVFLAIEKFQGN